MSTPARARSYVYVADTDAEDISVFALADDGGLEPRGTVAVQRPVQTGRSMLLAVSPNSKFLYAGYLSGAHYAAACFALDPDSGMPRHRGTAPLAEAMAYMTTDRSGRFLLSASYYADKVTVNALGADGLVGGTLQILDAGPKAHCILADPSNRHVLHTSLGGDVLYQQRFDAATGLLSANDPPTVSVAAGAGPRFLVFSPDARFVYLVCELDGSVHVFPYDGASGRLGRPVQTVSALPPGFAGRAWAADIRLAPGGEHLYVSERTSSTLAAFRVDRATGLVAIIGSYPTVSQPRATAIDPTGRYLVAAGQLSNSVAVHAIDAATGALAPLGEYPAGPNPTWVEIVSPA